MGIAAGLSSYFETKQGSKHFVTTTLERRLIESKTEQSYVLREALTTEYIAFTGFTHFYAGMYAEICAAAIYLLKSLGYDLRLLEQGTLPYEAAKGLISLSDAELEDILEKVKQDNNWPEIQQGAEELSAIINSSPSS